MFADSGLILLCSNTRGTGAGTVRIPMATQVQCIEGTTKGALYCSDPFELCALGNLSPANGRQESCASAFTCGERYS
eukprot:m.1000600 g.1000600  ORF g.1000600 m.1000600 type:complete len:77 (+) comp24027_c0_seq60:2807-3037(+)